MEFLLAFIPPPPPPAPKAALLGTTGTELLLFGLLVGAGVYHARRTGRDARRFLACALAVVSLFYVLCPEDSGLQRQIGGTVMAGMASLQAEVMRAAGASVIARGPSVVGSFEFTYARGCMGLSYFAMAVFCLLAQPVSRSRRVAGVFVLLAGMTVFNLLRLIILYFLWDRDLRLTYEVFHRIGGSLFSVAAFALYLTVLSLGTLREYPAGSLPLRPQEPAVSEV